MDRDLARRELHGLAGPGHGIGPPAGDLDRAVRRRPLQDRTGQSGECRLDRRACRRGPLARRQLALEVVGRRRGAETDRRAVGLAVAQVVLDDARPVARGRSAGRPRRRIQGPAMTDALRWRPGAERARRRRARSDRRVWRRSGCRRARGRATNAPRSASQRGDEPVRLGQHGRTGLLERRLDRGAGRACVPAATEPPGQDRGIDPARLRSGR